MPNGDNGRLKTINILVIIFVLANVATIILTIANYMQDGSFSLMSVVISLTTLSSILLIRSSLKTKNKP
jgi:hypothetical protein